MLFAPHIEINDALDAIIADGKRPDELTLKRALPNSKTLPGTNRTMLQYIGDCLLDAPSKDVDELPRHLIEMTAERRYVAINEAVQQGELAPAEARTERERAETDLDRALETLSAESKFVTAASFAGSRVPSRKWVVPDWIPAETATLLFGDGGTNKSLGAHQLAICVATGRPWFGLDVKRGRSLYIGAEDDLKEMHRRTAAIAKSMAQPLDLLTNFDIRCLVGENAVLATAINEVVVPTDRWREICRYVAKTRPVLVVIDTLAAVFAGNENSRTQAQQFVNLIAGPCIKYGATVLMLAHPSRAGMATGTGDSGTTQWSNAVRSRLYLERVKIDGTEPDLDARVLRSKKTNYAKTGAEIRLRWHAGTLIVDEDADGKSAVKAASCIKAENVFLDLLEHYESEGRTSAPIRLTVTPHPCLPRMTAGTGYRKPYLKAQ